MKRMTAMMLRTTLCLLPGVLLGCGGTEQTPQLAPDRTAPGAHRDTIAATCRWFPSLPSDREDPCTVDTNGAVLELTERPDMREESRSQQTHTCRCD